MASIVYVSSSTTDVITEIASTSEVIISNLQGPQGATGPQGPQGTPGGIASVVAPITNAGTETAAIIGINASSANTANYVVQRDANKEFVAGAVTIDTTLTPTSAPGKLYWDGGGTVNLGLAGGNVSVALGENLVSYVTNAEATTLAVGEVVYVFGASGDRPSVKRASNASEITSSKTLGIVAESIAAGAIGFVVTRGIIGKLALGSYTEGAPVYLGATAGTFTSTKPVAPANLVALGWVIRANNGNGQIYLNVQNGFELEELHNVSITSAANGNFLVYDSATTLWKNQAISATAPVTYNAGTRTIAANAATTSASGVVQLSDSTSTTSSTLAATPTAVKAAYDLASTANATANAAIPLAQKAAANGVATLDASGLVPTNQLPALAITNTFVVNSQAAMLALTAQTGDVAIRTDLSQSFILTADPASTLGNWQQLLSPPDAVTSVDGRVGAVTLTDKYAQLATANTFTLGPNIFQSGAIGNVALIARAATGQTANIQEWRDGSNSNVMRLTNTGSLILNTGQGISTQYLTGVSQGAGAYIETSSTHLYAQTRAATNIGLIVKGAASQSANLFEAQDSTGTVLANITSAGKFANTSSGQNTLFVTSTTDNDNIAYLRGLSKGVRFGSTTTFAKIQAVDGTNGTTSFQPMVLGGSTVNLETGGVIRMTVDASGNTLISGFTAATVGAIIKGAASQTGDLTQWQSSAGSVLAKVDSAGNIGTSNLTSAGGTAARITLSNASYSTLINSAGNNTSVLGVAQANGGQNADLLQLTTFGGTILDSFDNAGNQRSQAQLIQYGAEGSVLQNIPTRVHPAETLLKQAVWWIDSAHSGSSGQAIKNLGWGGAALDATAGSTTSADSNDPMYLGWSGVNYVYTPGISGNYLSAPDAAALDITGDIDLRVQVAMDDWTPSGSTTVLSKWASANQSFSFNVNAGGIFYLYWTTNGSTVNTAIASVANTITDGTIKWIRATLDVDNGASGNDVRFFTSDDGITWTQLGTTITTAGVTSIFSGTANVEISSNSNGTSSFLPAKIYRAQILNGIDGVPVLDVDTSVIASGSATSFTALTGQTVTINRSTSGRKTTVVTHPVWLFGTDDYMEVNNRWLERTTANYLYLPGVAGNYASAPDSAALDVTGDIDVRFKVAFDDWTPSANQYLFAKSSAGQDAYALTLTTNGRLDFYWVNAASAATTKTSSVAVPFTDGATGWVRATLDVDNGASGNDVIFYTSTDGTTWTQLGTTQTTAGVTDIRATTAPLNIGTYRGPELTRGKFFRAQVLNGIGGTVAFDANFETGITTNLPTTFTESSANAATVTINYSGTGYRSAGVIASTYVFPGNPNTFKLSSYSLLDFGASEDFSIVAITRTFGVQATGVAKGIITKGTYGVGNSWSLVANQSSGLQGNITADPAYAYSNLGAYGFATLTMTRAGATFATYRDSVSLGIAASSGTLSNSLANVNPVRIGQNSGFFADMEFVSAAVFRRALTAAEIATLNSYFQGRVA